MTAPADLLALGAADAESKCEHLAPAPVLITVHEVAFSTAAAAVPVRPARLPRWAGTPVTFLAAVRRALEASVPETRAPRGDVPRRYAYLEDACMSREMARL